MCFWCLEPLSSRAKETPTRGLAMSWIRDCSEQHGDICSAEWILTCNLSADLVLLEREIEEVVTSRSLLIRSPSGASEPVLKKKNGSESGWSVVVAHYLGSRGGNVLWGVGARLYILRRSEGCTVGYFQPDCGFDLIWWLWSGTVTVRSCWELLRIDWRNLCDDLRSHAKGHVIFWRKSVAGVTLGCPAVWSEMWRNESEWDDDIISKSDLTVPASIESSNGSKWVKQTNNGRWMKAWCNDLRK